MLNLMLVHRDSAPGQKESDVAIEKVNQCVHELDRASLAAISQSLQPRNDNSLQAFHDHLINSAKQMMELLEPLRAASRSQPEKVGHLVRVCSRLTTSSVWRLIASHYEHSPIG